MTMSKLLASAAVAASLVSAPVVAQAAAAERTATEVEGESLAGGFRIPALAILAVILGVVVLADGGDDAPVSP